MKCYFTVFFRIFQIFQSNPTAKHIHNTFQRLRRVLLVDKIDKLDQEDLLNKQKEEVQADLATSKKDPYNWEHIKQFYFAAELKEGIENSGLTSKRSSSNAIINITYVDALLGAQNLTGFSKSDIGKNLCPQS